MRVRRKRTGPRPRPSDRYRCYNLAPEKISEGLKFRGKLAMRRFACFLSYARTSAVCEKKRSAGPKKNCFLWACILMHSNNLEQLQVLSVRCNWRRSKLPHPLASSVGEATPPTKSSTLRALCFVRRGHRIANCFSRGNNMPSL